MIGLFAGLLCSCVVPPDAEDLRGEIPPTDDDDTPATDDDDSSDDDDSWVDDDDVVIPATYVVTVGLRLFPTEPLEPGLTVESIEFAVTYFAEDAPKQPLCIETRRIDLPEPSVPPPPLCEACQAGIETDLSALINSTPERGGPCAKLGIPVPSVWGRVFDPTNSPLDLLGWVPASVHEADPGPLVADTLYDYEELLSEANGLEYFGLGYLRDRANGAPALVAVDVLKTLARELDGTAGWAPVWALYREPATGAVEARALWRFQTSAR